VTRWIPGARTQPRRMEHRRAPTAPGTRRMRGPSPSVTRPTTP